MKIDKTENSRIFIATFSKEEKDLTNKQQRNAIKEYINSTDGYPFNWELQSLRFKYQVPHIKATFKNGKEVLFILNQQYT